MDGPVCDIGMIPRHALKGGGASTDQTSLSERHRRVSVYKKKNIYIFFFDNILISSNLFGSVYIIIYIYTMCVCALNGFRWKDVFIR